WRSQMPRDSLQPSCIHAGVRRLSRASVALLTTAACGPSVPPAKPCSDSPPLKDYDVATEPLPTYEEYKLEADVTVKSVAPPQGAGRSLAGCLPKTPAVDLSAFDTPIKNQAGGRCSAYGLVAAMENKANQLGVSLSNTCEGNRPAKVNLSETHQFWTQGFAFDSRVAVEKAVEFPIMEERYWREDNYRGLLRKLRHRLFGRPEKGNFSGLFLSKVRQIHNGSAFGTASTSEICETLHELEEKNPVYLALSLNSSLYAMDSPVDPAPRPTNGHAVSIVGYTLNGHAPEKGYFLLKNSWGEKRGRSDVAVPPGYQALPFQYCLSEGHYCGFWSVQEVAKKSIEWDGNHPKK
ncbi:MAG: C1 family peptidase, partial [Planctomycetota bacterium]